MQCRSAAVAAAAFLAVLIMGCGGGGGGGHRAEPGAVPKDEAYMPLAVGNRWVYEYRVPQINTAQDSEEPIPDHSTRTVIGTTEIDGKEWYEVEMIEWAAELGQEHPIDVFHHWFRETDEGVYLWHSTLRKPILWLKKPPRLDDHWAGIGPWGDGYDWFVQSTEDTITVPYGTLEGCVRILEQEPEDPEAGVRHEYLRWFKKGIGMVAEQYWHIPNDPQGPWDETALIECTIK